MYPQNAIVMVGDSSKALFLKNRGNERHLHLVMERVFEHRAEPAHLIGSDRPGRVATSFASGPRSALDATDPHEAEGHAFACTIARELKRIAAEEMLCRFVLVAPAKTMSDLRNHLDPIVRSRVIAEIVKDLTRHPIPDIEEHLKR